MRKKSGFYLFLSWLIPGAGHFILGKKIEGIVIFLSILYFFIIGIILGGRFIGTNEGSPLTVFLTFSDLGSGMFYFIGKVLGLGAQLKANWTSDYGTFFLVGGGLINYLAAVKAYEIAEGIKK